MVSIRRAGGFVARNGRRDELGSWRKVRRERKAGLAEMMGVEKEGAKEGARRPCSRRGRVKV